MNVRERVIWYQPDLVPSLLIYTIIRKKKLVWFDILFLSLSLSYALAANWVDSRLLCNEDGQLERKSDRIISTLAIASLSLTLRSNSSRAIENLQ